MRVNIIIIKNGYNRQLWTIYFHQVDGEQAPPLKDPEYAQTFKSLAVTRSNSEYDIVTKIAGQMIEQQGSNSTPINLLSIGAALRGFETI